MDDGDEALLARLRRRAWLPVTEARDGPATASKFSETPWLGPKVAWPECPRCREPMALFLRLDLDGLPERLGAGLGGGLLQFFFCTSRAECLIRGEGCWEPFSPYRVLRRIHPTPDSVPVAGPTLVNPIPARTIAGWVETDASPEPRECEDHGEALDDREFDILVELESPRQGDTLLGWPAWVQHVDYPRCRQCGRELPPPAPVPNERAASGWPGTALGWLRIVVDPSRLTGRPCCR